MPIVLDDIRWEQDANREALLGLLSTFGVTKPTSFILSGCAVSIVGSTYSWADGYLSISGEICKVVAGSVDIGINTSAKWSVSETYDATGNKTFEDSTSHDTYAIRRGVLVGYNPAMPDTEMPYDAPTLGEVIAAKAGPFIPGTWRVVGGGGSLPAFENSWVQSAASPAQELISYMKDAANVVHLRGSAEQADSAAGNIFTLPAGYRPAKTIRFCVWAADTGAPTYALVYILATGAVYITMPHLGAISLDGIYFHI